MKFPYSVNPETGCWEWQRYRQNTGYGLVSLNGKAVGAHRLYYEHHKGPIPEGRVIDHLCRNPGCVNPEHLEAVTQAENVRRGRGTTLSRADVAAIKASSDSAYDLAVRYDVHNDCIYKIRQGKSWADVEAA